MPDYEARTASHNSDLVKINQDDSILPEGMIRWVAYSKDEYGEWSEEVDLDVSQGTSRAEIKRVAQSYLSDPELFDGGLKVAHIEQKVGMYL